MKTRLGLIAGLGIGYYLGAMAGRERYQQINRMIGKVKGTDAYDTATDKARAYADVVADKAKEGVATAAGTAKDKIDTTLIHRDNSPSQTSEFSPS